MNAVLLLIVAAAGCFWVAMWWSPDVLEAVSRALARRAKLLATYRRLKRGMFADGRARYVSQGS